jgi:thiosulfate dehydrogenase
MPLGQNDSLSDQEAIDVADFMAYQPRPALAGARNDDSEGGRPKDARN